MAQTLHPYRTLFALVLSAVLVLNVAQLTQAKTAQYPPIYPSQNQTKDAIAYYYNFLGAFHHKNFLQSVDSISYGSMYGTGTFDRFGACVPYRFVSKQSKPGESAQIARHIFTFQYDPARFPTQPWTVVDMDVNAC